jgi:hypothetical protein
MLHQEVVEERGDVEEDGLGVEEEFGEEGEILGVQLGGYELVRVVQSSLLKEEVFIPCAPHHQSYESHNHLSHRLPLLSAHRLWQNILSSHISISTPFHCTRAGRDSHNAPHTS